MFYFIFTDRVNVYSVPQQAIAAQREADSTGFQSFLMTDGEEMYYDDAILEELL